MAWSAKRKLLHAEMLGAYHEARDAEMDEQAAGGWDGDLDTGDPQAMQQAAQQAGLDTSGVDVPGGGQAAPETVPNSPRQGQSANPVARHETAWDFSDDDTDWEFCPQCQGLFDPADNEYEAHFDNPEFPCTRDGGAG